MPVYNTAARLGACLEALRTQHLADCEFILVDDGSTDSTPAILDSLAAEDGRVRVTLHEGKYHQVKRMIAACDATVTFLKRVQLGGVRLDESLAPGEFRELTEEELGALRPPDGL